MKLAGAVLKATLNQSKSLKFALKLKIKNTCLILLSHCVRTIQVALFALGD